MAAKHMPRDMAYSPKVAQGVPIAQWMRGGMRDFVADNLAPSRIEESGIFDRDLVSSLLDQHMKGQADHAWRLWALLSVVLWQDVVLRRKQGSAPSAQPLAAS